MNLQALWLIPIGVGLIMAHFILVMWAARLVEWILGGRHGH